MDKKSLRDQVFRYVKKKYGSEIEYLWAKFPDYAVFRHEDNRKWYGLVMDVPKNRLGLDGEDYVDILNVKLDDWLLRDMLIQQDGYFIGYHISKGNWMSVLLDGTVPPSEIYRWIDTSYRVTASRAKQKKLRSPKEWLVPANPKYYDIEHAFDNAETIDWKQGNGIRTGDTVFLMKSNRIIREVKVIKVDGGFYTILFAYDDGGIKVREHRLIATEEEAELS